MLPNKSDLYSNHTYLFPNTSQLNQTHSLVSTLRVTNSLNISYEENATTTFPSICINDSNIYPTSKSEEKTYNIMNSLLLNITETPYTNESQTMKTYFNESQQYNSQMNDTNDFRYTRHLTARQQYHNNEKQHARPSTYGDQVSSYEQQYTVTYWMFYPYNQGKKICAKNFGFLFGYMFKPKLNGMCWGEEITMGNHVGDWEHISIRFSVSSKGISSI